MIEKLDLTGGEVRVIGNRGDKHTFRLNNPVGQDMLSVGGEYDAKFISHLGTETPVVLYLDELAAGVLSFDVTIFAGTYRVRRLNPIRTILVAEVEAR